MCTKYCPDNPYLLNLYLTLQNLGVEQMNVHMHCYLRLTSSLSKGEQHVSNNIQATSRHLFHLYVSILGRIMPNKHHSSRMDYRLKNDPTQQRRLKCDMIYVKATTT
jgi:hypothetical protein